jgi:hypothetical protein
MRGFVIPLGWQAERYSEDQPRDDDGRWTSGGGSGGAGGGSSKPATGYEFVSPNVASDLDFNGAVEAIDGDQQRALRDASLYINGALNVKATEHNIVGAWADGAENSVMDIVADSDWAKLELSGAMKGYLADQKQVLIFQQQDGGQSALYKFNATGSLAKIHKSLLEDGIAFHTLVPVKGGATVYVADIDGSVGDAVAKGAERYDSEVEVHFGRAEFLGTTKTDGTDREQRDSARESYAATIRKSAVQGSSEVWDRVRDRWGEKLDRAARGDRRAFRRERPFSLRYSEDQPRDENGKWTDGGGGSSDAPAPSPAASAVPSDAKPVEPAAPDTKTTKSKLDDFEKSKVDLGNFKADKSRADRFIEQWDSRVGESPGEFKQQFLGGVDATMHINVQSDGAWEIQGKILGAGGHGVGTYTRRIDWRDRSAESAFLQLSSSSTNKALGKKILAGNVETYQKLGLDKVKVHANIDVGGYAWAKYGYVPDRSSWGDLSSDILRKLGGESSGGGSGYRPESWDEISSHNQDEIRDAWMRSTRDDFVQSEVDNWRDNGDALDDAKYSLADTFDSDQEWALDAVNELIDEHKEDEKPIPYTATQILDAMTARYDTGYSGDRDPEFEFTDAALREPSDAPPKEQLNLPGFKPADLAEHLTPDMRGEITDTLTKAFNDQAQKNAEDLDPPEYIYENVGDYQHESWEGMSDREKYRWADNNGSIEEIASDDDDQGSLEVDPDDADDLRTLAESSDPKALWAIADSDKGKDLLLGTDWYGTLNLKDKETMERFNAYVGNAKGLQHAVAA